LAKAYGRVIRFYKNRLSKGLGDRCRFQPSCSDYVLESTEVEGLAMCVLRTSDRLQRCHPWADPYYEALPNGKLKDPYLPSVPRDKPLKRLLHAAASAVIPGAGQAIQGRWGDAAVSFLLVAVPTAACVAIEPEEHEELGIALGSVGLFFHAGNVLGGYQAMPAGQLRTAEP